MACFASRNQGAHRWRHFPSEGKVVMGVPRGPKLGSLARSNTPSGILQKIHHPYLPVRPLKAMPLCLLEIGL